MTFESKNQCKFVWYVSCYFQIVSLKRKASKCIQHTQLAVEKVHFPTYVYEFSTLQKSNWEANL